MECIRCKLYHKCDFVNRYFPDIMPEDVYRHYGHVERPKGELGKGVKYSKKANSQTSGKTADKTPEVEHLKGMQRQTVAKYARTKVYTKAEALEIIEQAARMLDETYGFDGGLGEVSGFVKLTKTVKDAAAVELWKAYNSVNTAAEKLEIARKLADTLMAEAQLVTLASDEELAEAREVTDCLRLG